MVLFLAQATGFSLLPHVPARCGTYSPSHSMSIKGTSAMGVVAGA
jgi:hypothetical protein